MPNIHSSISFALVEIPIKMNPIIKNNDTSFNQLHVKCGNRIHYIKYCNHCKKEVKTSDIIKGYEYEKNQYITFQKEELDKLKPEQEKTIEIVSFIPLSEIDPVYFEKSYLLEPEGKGKSYHLFYEALKKSKLVALAKTVIGSKFYYCILRLLEDKIMLTTLYFYEEVNRPSSTTTYKVNERELDLAMKLVTSLKGKFEPSQYKDEYHEKIKRAIDDKVNGKSIKVSKKKPKKQINDLMEALEKSLKENG